MIKTNTRTRILGTCFLFLAVPTIWAGLSEQSPLAAILLFIGWAVVGICIAVVLFPRIYMAVADGVLPDESRTDLFGWRIIGLVGMIIGVALFMAGLRALWGDEDDSESA